MRKLLPGTDIVSNPHINSKIHVWKKEYDPHVKGIRYKTLPYYAQWIEIFGKDKAIGENVVDPIDLVNELYRSGCEQEGETGDKYVPLTPNDIYDVDDNSVCKPTESTKELKKDGSSIENKQLNDIMKGIVGLKLFDKLKDCDELVQNQKHLDFFLSLPMDGHEEYVWMLLDGRL
ncbi:hypothetical protein ACS0TY_013934 [Phlomoides rotata]